MKDIITNIDSRSPLAESIKTLRTNLQFMRVGDGMQTILVTSTLPHEGKSWVSSNLAVAFAQAGKRTLLVDSDMRKGTVHYIFDLPLTPGLSNYLSGVNLDYNAKIESVIQKTDINNLFVVTAGDIPPNPSELLLSEKMRRLFIELEKMVDVVIFDGTPSLLVTDAMIISRMVSSTVIIAEYNKTKLNNVKEVKEKIENVGGKVAGVILNKVPSKSSRYGYGYGYRYGYGYGYGFSGHPVVHKEKKVLVFFKKVKVSTIEVFHKLSEGLKKLKVAIVDVFHKLFKVLKKNLCIMKNKTIVMKKEARENIEKISKD